ncbi:MAG: UDP-N-acetylenolpyruvoylglucosamine reductase [Candidatus Marinimicrobia bacterium]|nr:UDP-N-acetylenolpyruvoylglucosamine reductase [Candidatus Neomarinimicrobiota bacterium]|tara:strand:- start:10553 stop:11473 length:921 start_codon:yes stop_codon:yes gene_type:complete
MRYEKDITNMINGVCLINEPMSKHTTYGIGGPCSYFIKPRDKKDLKTILKFANENSIKVYFVGSGSNLLVSDSGIDGIVISLDKVFKNIVFLTDTEIYAEAGAMLGKMVKLCIGKSLTGFESLIGVPGTLGGALIMNAGAFGGEISKCISYVDIIRMDGTEHQYKFQDIEFQYRSSSFSKDEILVGASFRLEKDSKENIQAKRYNASQGRKSTQPLRVRSAGSVFKNPKNTAAGYLIDKAGLKGTASGGAVISSKHANFFVNSGNASSNDIVALIRLARKAVMKKFGIHLELEIKPLGFPKGTFDV